MKTIILGIFLSLVAAGAGAGPAIGKSDYFPLEPNIAVDIDAPGAVRAEIAISIPSLDETHRYEVGVTEGSLTGGVYLQPGAESRVRITAFDARGEKIYAGEGYVVAGKELTPQVDIPLEGGDTKEPHVAKLGTYRLEVGLAAGPNESGMMLQVTLFDAKGKHLPFEPGDLEWRGALEKFELLPYSCFRESLCIELPDPRIYEVFMACMRDVVCSHQKPKDTRGPYRYVAVGRNHTCALTITDEIRCWGDNRYGQLRTNQTACPSTTGTWPSYCSLTPVPVECGPGEICRFQSLAAGGERTCAVDTTGRLWCWGSNPDTNDDPAPLSYADRFNGEVEVFTAGGAAVRFISVDVDLRQSCAISTTRALYCWEFNQSSLDDKDVHNPGVAYQSVSVGKSHVCARRVSGKFECWGSDFDGQLDGTHTGSSGVLHPGLQEILTRGGHRPSAGATSSCAQDPDDNTICWGSPSHWVGPSSATGGWLAIRHSYATSISSNADMCAVTGGSLACTRICATGLAGELFCGNWKSWANPTQLPVIPDPKSDHYIAWNQVDVGPNHVCGVTNQRDVWCFGLNPFGQFGIGTTSISRTNEPLTPVIR